MQVENNLPVNTSSTRQHVSTNPDDERLDRNREIQRIRELETENMSLRQQVGALSGLSIALRNPCKYIHRFVYTPQSSTITNQSI